MLLGVCLQQDSYLQGLVRAVQQAEAEVQQPAVQVLACLIAQDPSTHYICAEVTPLAHHQLLSVHQLVSYWHQGNTAKCCAWVTCIFAMVQEGFDHVRDGR